MLKSGPSGLGAVSKTAFRGEHEEKVAYGGYVKFESLPSRPSSGTPLKPPDSAQFRVDTHTIPLSPPPAGTQSEMQRSSDAVVFNTSPRTILATTPGISTSSRKSKIRAEEH
jgi:hypothetical protein